jgi:hypothetical protein
MNRRTVSLCVVLLLGCLLLGLIWNSTSQGQGPAAKAGKVGKYQVTTAIFKDYLAIIVCDTETGQIWEKFGSKEKTGRVIHNRWQGHDLPVPQKK